MAVLLLWGHREAELQEAGSWQELALRRCTTLWRRSIALSLALSIFCLAQLFQAHIHDPSDAGRHGWSSHVAEVLVASAAEPAGEGEAYCPLCQFGVQSVAVIALDLCLTGSVLILHRALPITQWSGARAGIDYSHQSRAPPR